MKIGFSKINLIDAIDWQATTAVSSKTPKINEFSRERKFDISDRVTGMWRPEEGGNRKVIEPMHISFLYSEDTNGPFVLAAMDHCDLDYDLLDLMREPIINECRIPLHRIVFLPSHCHVTVDYDKDKLQQSILVAVNQAKANMVEVEIGFLNVKTNGKKFVINRRIDVNGIGTRTIMFNDFCDIKEDHLDATGQVMEWIRNLGANPLDYMNENQRFVTHQDVDDRLQALFFRDKKTKKITGNFVRFAAHAVIVSEKKVQGDISADYPGYLKKRLESQLGSTALFAQGLSGDLRPLNPVYSHKFAKTYGVKLADMLISEVSDLTWKSLKQLEFFPKSIHLPLRKDLPKNREEGEAHLKRIEKLYEKSDQPERRRKLQNDFWFYYRSGEVAKLLRPEWREQGFIDAFQFGLKLNDIAIVMHPGEMFYSTGLEMIGPFPEKQSIMVGIANEYISYIPPNDDIKSGGYEPSVCLVDPESAQLLVKNTHKLLEKMTGNIRKEILRPGEGNTKWGFSINELLKGEIEGINTNHVIIPAGNQLQIQPKEGEILILLFTGGKGIIKSPTGVFHVQEMAVFISDLTSSFIIKAPDANIEFLQINRRLKLSDEPFLRKFKKKYPYFMNYSQCKMYKEEIKSEKTISRMLVPEEVVPRLSIGSVQTTGPDRIAAHQHPMLEQLFYGLKGNSCHVHADDHETAFGEQMLLHIPLGSNHGVRVDEGHQLHYIWMDFFKHQEDLSYITDSHIITDE